MSCQFLVLRLEDYHNDPKAYIRKVFEFMQVPVPEGKDGYDLMDHVVSGGPENAHV